MSYICYLPSVWFMHVLSHPFPLADWIPRRTSLSEPLESSALGKADHDPPCEHGRFTFPGGFPCRSHEDCTSILTANSTWVPLQGRKGTSKERSVAWCVRVW